MTDRSAQDREELCRILHDANTGKICPDDDDPTRYGAMAEAVLARLGGKLPSPPLPLPLTADDSEEVNALFSHGRGYLTEVLAVIVDGKYRPTAQLGVRQTAAERELAGLGDAYTYTGRLATRCQKQCGYQIRRLWPRPETPCPRCGAPVEVGIPEPHGVNPRNTALAWFRWTDVPLPTETQRTETKRYRGGAPPKIAHYDDSGDRLNAARRLMGLDPGPYMIETADPAPSERSTT